MVSAHVSSRHWHEPISNPLPVWYGCMYAVDRHQYQPLLHSYVLPSVAIVNLSRLTTGGTDIVGFPGLESKPVHAQIHSRKLLQGKPWHQ